MITIKLQKFAEFPVTLFCTVLSHIKKRPTSASHVRWHNVGGFEWRSWSARFVGLIWLYKLLLKTCPTAQTQALSIAHKYCVQWQTHIYNHWTDNFCWNAFSLTFWELCPLATAHNFCQMAIAWNWFGWVLSAAPEIISWQGSGTRKLVVALSMNTFLVSMMLKK